MSIEFRATGRTATTQTPAKTPAPHVCGRCGGLKTTSGATGQTVSTPTPSTPQRPATPQTTAQPAQPTAPAVQQLGDGMVRVPAAEYDRLAAQAHSARLQGLMGEDARLDARFAEELHAASGGSTFAASLPLVQQLAAGNLRRAEAERRDGPEGLLGRALLCEATIHQMTIDDLRLLGEHNPTLLRRLAEKGDDEKAEIMSARERGGPRPLFAPDPWLHPHAVEEVRRLRASMGKRR